MGENISLVKEIRQNETGVVMALIEKNWSYLISFDVSGECNLDLKIKDSVTNKMLQSITKHNQFITGQYSFPIISLNSGVLAYDFTGVGQGVVTNIKVIKGGR